MLKHMPKDVLKTLQNSFLYSNYMTTPASEGNRTDQILTVRITKFQEQLKNECL